MLCRLTMCSVGNVRLLMIASLEVGAEKVKVKESSLRKASRAVSHTLRWNFGAACSPWSGSN